MIEAEHLTKYYANYPAIEDVTFVAAPGYKAPQPAAAK